AFNTLGSIFGALLAGFLIVPTLGAVTAWRLCAGLLALSAVGCAALALQRVQPRQFGAVALSLVTAGVALMTPLATGPTSTWRHEPIGVGRANFSGLDRNQLRQRMAEAQARTVWERDGRESNVQLASGVALSFSINGKSDGNVWADRGTQTMLGLVPAMLHGKAQRAFVVGLGTGMSAGWLAQLPSMQHVDVAEIEPAVVDVARAAHESNADVLNNPKVSVFLGDAREFMLTSTERYDVIASEPSNPYRAGIASLFTAEFYGVVADRLNPDGIFAQWVQGYEIDVATVRTVLRTLRHVFPFVEVWQTQGADFLMIGTKQAPSISRDALAQQLSEPPLRDLLPRMWLVEGVEGVLAHFIADSALTQEVSELGNPAINSDDTNVLEYSFAHTAGNSVDDLGVVQKLAQHAVATRHAKPKVVGEVNWAQVNELRSRAWLLGRAKAPPVQGAAGDDTLRIRAFHQGCAGDASQVLALWQQQAQTEPGDIVETYTLGLGMAVKGDTAALPLIDRLEQRGFLADARLLQAELALAQGSIELGMQRLLESLTAQRQGLIPLCNVSERTLQRLGKLGMKDPGLARLALAALAQGPLISHLRNRERIDWMERLGHATRDPVLCVQALGRSAEHPWWDQGFLQRRHECLNAARHPLAQRAELDLLEYLSATSGTFAGPAAPQPESQPPAAVSE
ncbi:MAG TPA: fused MFS/spermidine synthase, partial [Polyangiaceae bacterium]|nr:fused MFS/spermidine synthase [Polyangiaceae bacterium]